MDNDSAAVVSTPVKDFLPTLSKVDTPVGDQDKKAKIQLCVELREHKGKKKSQRVLEVTVLAVKNLPEISGRAPVPFVKVEMLPDRIIFTTQPKQNQKDSNYADLEIFEFPLKMDKLEGKTLEVQVCDRKVTRNAKIFGKVVISLKEIKVNQPLLQWHELAKSDTEE